MPGQKLKEYLDEHKVKYLCLDHSPAYTAQEVAQSAHVSGRTFLKTVIVHVDDRLAMAVVHSPDRLDLEKLRQAVGAGTVRLATEEEFKDAFADCEAGAMPPFGNLYGMEIFLERDVPTKGDIVFSAGSHKQVIALSFNDFQALAEPVTVSMAALQ